MALQQWARFQNFWTRQEADIATCTDEELLEVAKTGDNSTSWLSEWAGYGLLGWLFTKMLWEILSGLGGSPLRDTSNEHFWNYAFMGLMMVAGAKLNKQNRRADALTELLARTKKV